MNLNPIAPTLADPAQICTGEDIELSANSSQTGGTCYWVGPGGFDATMGNPLLITTNSNVTIPLTNCAYEAGEWSVIISDLVGCFSEMALPKDVEIIALEWLMILRFQSFKK